MMIVDHCRDIEELRTLYNERPMPMQYEFEWLINNPNLFCFYDEGVNEVDSTPHPHPLPRRGDTEKGKLRGFITVQIEDGELTLSGTSIRKIMPDVITAIISVCEQFEQDMYSYTTKREAKLVLKKAGFEEIEENKFIRRYKNG